MLAVQPEVPQYMFSVQFYGVRGSTPSCDPGVVGFGGNTSCVLVQVPGEDPIILDLGTGLRALGVDLVAQATDAAFSATALVTHMHWDHVQGLPFFAPLLKERSSMTIIGPPQIGSNLDRAFGDFVKPPLFPVCIDELPCELNFVEATNRSFRLGSATVTAFPVPHTGTTNGYRIECGSASVAYIPDHQQPSEDPQLVPQDVVENCRGVDILVHDSQYGRSEFLTRKDWGHCTTEFAVAMAKECGARRLVLFHHDPSHNDAWVENAVTAAQRIAPPGLVVTAAAEGNCMQSGTPDTLSEAPASVVPRVPNALQS